MDFETRMHRRFIAVLVAGGFAGIAAGSLTTWLLDIELSRDALWFDGVGGGLVGVLTAAVYGWRTMEAV
ncbi:hypothetical protein [Streptomyces sp. SPB4]|uniref:hypothetical protein n=1 Tax=Streptomyces sp. SPB4 TaxID=2940553 RepID=UPI0024761153|nr:hypothetical protein [Streptomyces sp. SPB4]MDH6545535.1 hypothetical protein [Streptomyces sp. SPB4]